MPSLFLTKAHFGLFRVVIKGAAALLELINLALLHTQPSPSSSIKHTVPHRPSQLFPQASFCSILFDRLNHVAHVIAVFCILSLASRLLLGSCFAP